MKNIFLAVILMTSTSAFALHNLENPEALGDPFVDSSEEGTIPTGDGYLQKGEGDAYGSITENPPQAEEDPGMWERIESWWADE